MTIVLDDDLGVQSFLDVYAKHLTDGNGKALAAMWETPAFVLHKDGATVIADRPQIETLSGGARKRYNALGILGTRADVERVDVLNDDLVAVRVRWPHLDAHGKELGAETSTYTLARKSGGDWKLRITVIHGVTGVGPE